MDTGKDPSERGRHQALAGFIEDHDMKDTSIFQRPQERKSIGTGRRYALLAFHACTEYCFSCSRVEWCSLWQPPSWYMSRISTNLAHQRYSNNILDSKKPTHVSNRPVNRPQSACKNRPNLALSSMISSPFIIRFKNGAAQTQRYRMLLSVSENFVQKPLDAEHLDASGPLSPSCQAWICPVLQYSPLDKPDFLRL